MLTTPWTLRRKFGLIGLIYVTTLAVNLVMSCYCIVVYFQSALLDAEAAWARQQQIELVRTLVRRHRTLIQQQPGVGQTVDPEAARLASAWQRELSAVDDIMQAGALHGARDEIRTLGQRIQSSGSSVTLEDFNRLETLLGQAGDVLAEERQATVAQAATKQQHVVRILIVNAAIGCVLCVAGLLAFRRWVTRPVEELREAAKQLSTGNFAHRMKPERRDELGQLALDVNQMSATLSEMQTQLVERERLAAAGEMVTRLAHNIRNPIAGIRGLAEATAAQHHDDDQTVECQQRIIATVDRFEKWLHQLQQSVSPVHLQPKAEDVCTMMDHVLTALRPMLDRRKVHVALRIEEGLKDVMVDSLHMEQALVALVTNAVQASRAGMTVRVHVAKIDQGEGRWQLEVIDEGEGIAPELMDKIRLPYFTTKADGNGLGLAMADKVVRLHGGTLSIESEQGRGSRFTLALPGFVSGTNSAPAVRPQLPSPPGLPAVEKMGTVKIRESVHG